MLDLIEQIICELKHAQLRAGGITDGELAKRLGMSQSAFSVAKHKGFGIAPLYAVADALGCEVEVRLREKNE